MPDASRFCPHCGTPQSMACAACGHTNTAGSRFCGQCGAKLGGVAPIAQAPLSAVKPPPPRASSIAERRQLTVMFCDLVGSTALSTRIDPEDLRDVIAAYHKCVAEVVTRFNGYIAKYMGDGVLVYFGYPEAHETDAENAVRAGLAMVEAIGALAVGEGRHQVRIGIATGLVIVGELLGAGEAQERNVVGETPNLAARLQSTAAANTVVIAESTRRLTEHAFECEAVNTGQLKGFDGPVVAWRVLREQSMQSRFEALRTANLTPLVGRQEELELLSRRWQQAKGGEGRAVLLSGEPGIGKSRLTAALIEHLSDEQSIVLRYFCLPHTQHSALHPIVTQLQHAAGFDREDSPAQKRDKLKKLLSQGGDTPPAAADALTELLGLAIQEQSAVPIDPKRKRAEILNALLGRLENLALREPILMSFEDVHWGDPTSLELLTLTIERIQTLPVLLIITHRPDFPPPWTGQPHVTSMTLNRLGRRERLALVEHLTAGKSLPPTVLDQIIERTDGIPLFVEELTKAILESEELDSPAQQVVIPTTLQASLMARVDRLGSAREALQIGAAIGREFSYEQIAAVAGLPDAVLQDALARLTEAELLLIRGAPPNATYAFKHALVQDTAYSTMLRARRQALHGAIAQVLEKRFPDTAPEVLAQQFEGAGRNDKAIELWRQAGERDLRRFAMKEAVAHFCNALRLVEGMPEGATRDGLELNLRLGLGLVQLIAIGPSAKEAKEQYVRALALSSALPGRGREHFLATWGMWFNAATGGHNENAAKLSDELVAIARELDDADLLLEAYHAKVPMLLKVPDFTGAEAAAREVFRLYDRARHRDHAFYFGGHDSLMCARSFCAQSLWGQGLLDQAQKMVWQSIEDARALGHIFSLAHALQRAGMTFMLLKDVEACRTAADELLPLAERNKFPWQWADGVFMRGWLAACDGDFEGLEKMAYTIAQPFSATFLPTYLSLIAEQELRAKNIDKTIAWVERAFEAMRSDRNSFCESEFHRLHGEALLMRSPSNNAQAEQNFRKALVVARKQLCPTLELRAATSLARLLRSDLREAEAREVLAPVYAAFTEGFGRPDLETAKALLTELS